MNAQKLSFHLKGPNEDFDGQRGELGESLVKFEIDERLWNASSESVYTISISKKVFASVPLGLLRKNGFNDEIVVHRDQDGFLVH